MSHATKVPAPRPTLTAVAVSLSLAVALNALALGAFGSVVTQWRQAGAPRLSTGTWITAVALPERKSVPPVEASGPNLQASSKADQTPEPAPSTTVTPRTVLQATHGSPETAARFYRTGEVDRPAFPDSDWNLDTAVLDVAGLERLVFEVYINDRGEVVRCKVLEPVDLAEPLRATLEGRLRETKLSPATRAGAPVPSFRRIELSVLPAQQ
jgi:hypothetical protein